MLEGTRLNYVVPGYTGHIPHKVYSDFVPIAKEKPRYQIPGYAGYVSAIKPENLHAKTFGKLTYDISDSNYLKGQDHLPEDKYVSCQIDTHISPSEMLQRTAADIVGVENRKIEIKEPSGFNTTGPEIDQFTQTREWRKTSSSLGKTSMTKSNVVTKEGKPYGILYSYSVELGEPLPGYTGFNKRIVASNIFGKTYAESRKEAYNNQDSLNNQKNRNYHTQLESIPPIKY